MGLLSVPRLFDYGSADDAPTLAIEVDEDAIAEFEWIEDAKTYRWWLVPAALLNACPVRFLDSDDLDARRVTPPSRTMTPRRRTQTTMNTLPPPAPPVWAPRFRKWLNRWLTAMDRRKARQLAGSNQSVLDIQWKARYREWWDAGGWATGAAPPDEAYWTMIRHRRSAP